MIDGISEYRAWRPEKGEKFRAWCRRGGGEFFAGRFGPLICTRTTSNHVLAAPSQGVHPDYINTEILKFDRTCWRFVAESQLSPEADTE